MKYRNILGPAIIVAFVLLGVAYGSEGREMPDNVFNLLVVIGAVLLIVVVPLWIASYAILPAMRFFRRYEYHWPMVAKGKPNPNKWLLDMAEHDAENPQGELRLLSQRVVSWDMDPKTMRPSLELGFNFFNGGIHTILIGPADGRAKYDAKELPDPVEAKGRSRLKRGDTKEYRVKVVLPPDVAKVVFEREITTETARSVPIMRSISLSGVTLQIESEPADGNERHAVSFGLGQADTFPVGKED